MPNPNTHESEVRTASLRATRSRPARLRTTTLAMASSRAQSTASSTRAGSRPPPTANERTALLAARSHSPTRSSPAVDHGDHPDAALESDAEGAHKRVKYGGTSTGGSSTPRHDAAFATLPHRLTRAASIQRKQERQARERTQWQDLSIRCRYYIPVVRPP